MTGSHSKQIVPATRATVVVTSDVTVFAATRGIWVGGGGNVRVLTDNGDDVTFSGVAAGTLLPISVTKIFATSTTATLILALY